MKLIFDIETDDLNATRVWCIVAKDLEGKLYKFSPNEIQDGLDLLSKADTLIGPMPPGYGALPSMTLIIMGK